MKIEPDPKTVAMLAKQKQDANWAFRCFLKKCTLSAAEIDAAVHDTYQAVAARIDCRSYPHLHKKPFVARLTQAYSNCSVCPIVYNVYEELKKRLWDRGKSLPFLE
ncbi:MAG: hypothetical protein JXR37_34970 [Kiritimatiellae bacterium]|nr:hypothetical protein [Kiritimatiellia bacterium]